MSLGLAGLPQWLRAGSTTATPSVFMSAGAAIGASVAVAVIALSLCAFGLYKYQKKVTLQQQEQQRVEEQRMAKIAKRKAAAQRAGQDLESQKGQERKLKAKKSSQRPKRHCRKPSMLPKTITSTGGDAKQLVMQAHLDDIELGLEQKQASEQLETPAG